MDNSLVLQMPFDIETHKKTFINYLEIVILENGTIEYATPSHQEKLIKIACNKLEVTREELEDMCPKEYYCDFITWLNIVSGAIPVWNDFYLGKPNDEQIKTLEILKKEKLYLGKIQKQQER